MDDPAAGDPRPPDPDARQRHLETWRRHAKRLDQKAREHPLRYLFLEVTRRCNLACAYCGSSCTGASGDAEMDSRKWVEVIDQVARDFDPASVMVAITGGEPLLKPGILQVFHALRDHGFPYGMVTNGLLLDAAWAHALMEARMGSISVSLDGPPEVNDAQRGPGTFERAARAIRLLQEAGFPGKMEALSTLTRPAIPHLDRMRGLLAAMRVPLWRVAPVMPIGRAREHPDLVPGPREVRALLEWVLRARQDPRLPVPEHSEEGFLGWRFEGRVRPYLAQCRAGVEVAGIMADGRIGACPELPPSFHQGDIRRERLRDVWEQRYQVFRDRSWTRRGPCGTCDHWEWCRGGALHLYPEPGGDFVRCLYMQAKEAEQPPEGPHPKSA